MSSLKIETLDPGALSGPSFMVIPHAASKKLVVFFSGTDRRNGRFDWWGTGRQQAAHQIFLNNGANEWYQRGVPGFGRGIDGTATKIKEWAKFLDVDEVYMVGVSMGGHGAALYGAILNAKVLAFGFDPIIRIPGSRSEARMPPRIKTVVADLATIIENSTAKVFHFAGECDAPDLVGAQHMDGRKNVTVTTFRGVGHGGAPFIEKEFGLAKFLNLFLENKPLPRFTQEGDALHSPKLVAALNESHLASIAKDVRLADEKAREALRLSPHCEAALYQVGLYHFRKKQFLDALPLFAQVVAQCPHFDNANFKLGQTLRLLGEHRRALPLFQRHVSRRPKSSSGYLNIALCLSILKRRQEALEAIMMAKELDPESQPIATHLKRMSRSGS